MDLFRYLADSPLKYYVRGAGGYAFMTKDKKEVKQLLNTLTKGTRSHRVIKRKKR